MHASQETSGAVPPALEVREIRQRFGARTVLDIDDWIVKPGQHALINGPSGCGKSTLLHLIAGLLRPSQGRVLVTGRALSQLRPAELDVFRGRTIGIVLQNLHLIGALTVYENIALARSLAALPPDRQAIDRLLHELGLSGHTGARPAQLSHGERQRAAIARAVINQPALVLADEPTSALDDANCDAVISLLLAQARASDATLVVSTHDARLQEHFNHRLDLSAVP